MTGWNKVPRTRPANHADPPIDDLEALLVVPRPGQTLALVEVMDEFGERHDGSP
jgi:hypothetical protein